MTVRDRLRRPVTFVSSQHDSVRVSSSTLIDCLQCHYFRTRNIVSFLLLVYLCCLRVVTKRHKPSHLLADRVYWTCMEWVSIDIRYHKKQNLAILITYQRTWSLLALSFLSLFASADISSTWAANWEWNTSICPMLKISTFFRVRVKVTSLVSIWITVFKLWTLNSKLWFGLVTTAETIWYIK